MEFLQWYNISFSESGSFLELHFSFLSCPSKYVFSFNHEVLLLVMIHATRLSRDRWSSMTMENSPLQDIYMLDKYLKRLHVIVTCVYACNKFDLCV